MSRDTVSPFRQETGSSKVYEYIEEWKSRLIDLSRRNRLLYFKHATKGNLLVTSPDTETVFYRLVHRKRGMEFWMPPKNKSQPARRPRLRLLSFLSAPEAHDKPPSMRRQPCPQRSGEHPQEIQPTGTLGLQGTGRPHSLRGLRDTNVARNRNERRDPQPPNYGPGGADEKIGIGSIHPFSPTR